ncbi:MAG: TetR/AcrR family transcriptional regulator [Pseudomonadales bacterium]|jgi:AcrR family transcriptional regulator
MTETSDDLPGSYHHGDLRLAILKAACDHLRRENAESLSLRALARGIGVSQTAPYRHFDSKNALFAGIATWGFQILGGQMQASLADQTSPMESFLTLGRCYLDFSREHAEKYQLFFDSSLVEFGEYPRLQEASGVCFDHLLDVIRLGQQDRLFIEREEEEIAAIVWAGLHGMASLLQLKHGRQGLTDRPVGKAIRFLAEQQDQTLNLLLRSVLK